MCKIIPFPSADLRRAIRTRRLRRVLDIARREGFVHVAPSEQRLLSLYRRCSAADRQFIERAAAALQQPNPCAPSSQPASQGERP